MLVLSAICGVHGELVRVNWTLSGVADYRDPRYNCWVWHGHVLARYDSNIICLFCLFLPWSGVCIQYVKELVYLQQDRD